MLRAANKNRSPFTSILSVVCTILEGFPLPQPGFRPNLWGFPIHFLKSYNCFWIWQRAEFA